MANFLILAPFPSWIYQEVAEGVEEINIFYIQTHLNLPNIPIMNP